MQTERDDAVKHMTRIAKTLTGNDASVVTSVENQLKKVDTSWDFDQSAKLVNRFAKQTADHHHNIGLGHSGRNRAMSNRTDVTTSPGRTTILDEDADILEGIEIPLLNLLGPQLTEKLLEVPTSPKGVHILSSKQQEQ